MELSQKDEEYIISLLKQGKKLNAVEFVKEKARVSLLEAKQYIDKKINNEYYEKNVSISKEDKEYISSLIKENKKLEAVAFLHKERKMNLEEAKNYVDREEFKLKISTKKISHKKTYIFNEKLNIFIPDLGRQRKITKIILNILLILVPVSLIQLYFLDRTSLVKMRIFGFSIVWIPVLLILYFGLILNIHFVEKKIKEIENLELLNEFEIKSYGKNIELFFNVILFIILFFGIYVFLKMTFQKPTYKNIFYIIFLIGLIIFNCYVFLETLKNRKYSLNLNSKTVKILYNNNEINSIKIDNINFVKFYAKKFKSGRTANVPIMQIFNKEKNIFVEMTIKTIDYHLLKMYFTKYKVLVDDTYNFLPLTF